MKIGYRMINARAESVAEKPSFRTAFKKRRCLVLADGFYEWKKDGTKKTTMRIILNDQEPFAFAGMWDSWKSPEGELVHSCTIITTTPNELIKPIHNRIPLILSQEFEEIWLDATIEDPKVLSSMLIPFPARSMEACIASDLVNSPKNETPNCIAPVQAVLPY